MEYFNRRINELCRLFEGRNGIFVSALFSQVCSVVHAWDNPILQSVFSSAYITKSVIPV